MTEAFNRAHLEADYPVDDPAAIPPWQATKGSLDATQAEADAAAKRFWQRSSWYRRANIHNESLAGQPIIDDVSAQGAVLTTERTEAADAGDLMATRRLEDERYAAFAEISMVWLDLPDAVFRGYEGDDELLGAPRDDDPAPVDALRRELARLEPQRVYVPLGHRRPRRPPADPQRRHRAPPRRAALGDAGRRLDRPARVLRGLPVRVVGGVPPARGPPRRLARRASPRASR